MTQKTSYFVLSELNIPKLIWRIATRRPSCILFTRSLFAGGGNRILNRLVDYLHQKGRVQILKTDLPERILFPFFGDLIRCTNVFAECEPWLEDRLHFSQADSQYKQFAVPYRHACANAAFDRYFQAYTLYGVLKEEEQADISGLDAFDADYLNFRFPDLNRRFKGAPTVSFLPNTCLLLISALYSIVSIVIRMRPGFQQQSRYRLGSDFVDNKSNPNLWNEVSDSPDDVLIVFRSVADRERYKDHIDGRPYATSRDGRFTVWGGLQAIGLVVSGYLTIYRSGVGLPTSFFIRLVNLPYWQAMYRGLLNRYHCDYYWGRDDYNPEHALRSLELRRKKSVALGLMHGIPSITNIVHQLRHIDFDVYFVAGAYQAETYYKKWWPPHMKVVAVGSYGLPRQQFLEMQSRPKKNGIACFCSPVFFHDEILLTLEKIAKAFPHRTIYLQSKKKPSEQAFDKDLVRFAERAPDNVEVYKGPSYDLFFECDTVLSPGSTLSAEAIQFGLNSFVFDYHPEQWKVLVYREFPGACVSSAEELLQRLKDIENGTWQFPNKKWSPLIDMSGTVPWDIIRREMGLADRTGSATPDQLATAS